MNYIKTQRPNKNIVEKDYSDFGADATFKELTKYLDRLEGKVVNVDVRNGLTIPFIMDSFNYRLFRIVANHRNYKLDMRDKNLQLELYCNSEEKPPIIFPVNWIRRILKGGIFHWDEFIITLRSGQEMFIYSCDEIEEEIEFNEDGNEVVYDEE